MSKRRAKKTGPWVSMAVLCLTSLEEKDNVLSAIRIVDRFTIQKPPGWDTTKNIPVPMHALIGFKSGDVKGERKVRVFGISPTGKRKKVFEMPVLFAGGDSGTNLRLNVVFAFKTAGTHWFDVYVDRWLATRMPLTIVLEEPAVSETPTGNGAPSEGGRPPPA